MVIHPGDYGWSSYACNAMGRSDPLISKHLLYTELGDDQSQQQYAYRELFRNHLDNNEIHSIRESLNQELVLGRDDFKEKIQLMTKRQVNAAKLGRPRIAEERGCYLIL
jgi:putative transposase